MNIATALRAIVAHADKGEFCGSRANGHDGPENCDFIDYTEVDDTLLDDARAALAAHDAAVLSGHYCEPWQYRLDVIYSANGEALAGMYVNGREKARIVACVNACQGIADPVAYVTETRAIVESLRARIDADNAMTPQAIMVRRAHTAIAGDNA